MNDPLDRLHALGRRARHETVPCGDVTSAVMRHLREPATPELPIRSLTACAGLLGGVTIVVVATLQWWSTTTPPDRLEAFFQVASAQDLWRNSDVERTR